MAATWDEACEGHAYAHGRPGVPAVAALLPLAVAGDRGLDATADALALAYEVGARAGGWLRIKPGMHVDGNWPALGVAAGVARLLGQDADGIGCAIDIAACWRRRPPPPASAHPKAHWPCMRPIFRPPRRNRRRRPKKT